MKVKHYWMVLVKEKNGKWSFHLETHRTTAEEFIEPLKAAGIEASLYYFNNYSNFYEEVIT